MIYIKFMYIYVLHTKALRHVAVVAVTARDVFNSYFRQM